MKLQIHGKRQNPWRVGYSVERNFAFATSTTCFRNPFVNSQIPVIGFTATRTRTSLCRVRPSCSSRVKAARMQPNADRHVDLLIDRESFLRISTFVALSTIPLGTDVQAETQFSTYNGPISLGFSFSYPSSWTITKKAIKTHLSEVIVSSKDDSSTTAGLVVDAIKIDVIDKFGTPQTVGQNVVDVEKRKESVKDATVQSATAVTKDGLTYYVIDYTVDSARGQKRYIAKATVTGNQLYVFTAQAKVGAFQGETADLFAKMLDSFNVVKQYL